MLPTDIQKRLNGPLPAHAVRQREASKGQTLSYVDGFYVFDLLNDVLGVGGWTYTVHSLDLVQDETKTKDGKERRYIGYLCRVELTVIYEGVYPYLTIQDVGFGQGIDADTGKAHESAAKEAVTDAVKRAARKLGRACGLALYDKSQEHVVDDPEVVAKRELFLAHCEEKGYTTPADEMVAVGATLKSEAEELGVAYEDWRAAFKRGRERGK